MFMQATNVSTDRSQLQNIAVVAREWMDLVDGGCVSDVQEHIN